MIQIRTHDFPQLSYHKDGTGPALFLIHGFPATSALWRNIAPELSLHFKVITPDLPGSGDSLLVNELSMELMAGSIISILDHEDIEKAIIVGHSMGGYAALAFAELYPARIKGLSLVHSTALADTEEKKETRRKAMELIRKGGKEPFVKQMVPNLFAAWSKQKHPGIVNIQIEDGLREDADSMIAMYNAMINRPDRQTILRDISVPVQWIIGREDNLLPFDKALQQSYLANLNFVNVYKKCGHMSMLEYPGLLCADLTEFAKYCYS